MGLYTDIKRKKFKGFLKWLSRKSSNIEIKKGGNHNILIKYLYGKRPFPIPFKHGVINKHIIKDLMKKLTEEWRVCSKDEFDKKIK